MIKRLSIVVLLVVCGCATSRHDTSLTSIQLVDRNGFSETISGKERLGSYEKSDFTHPQPYTKIIRHYGKKSLLTTYHDNGQIREFLEVFGGRAMGSYIEWFPNGKVKLEATLIEGMGELSEGAKESWVFDGTSYVWNESGQIVAEIQYDKGRLEGTSRYYDALGNLSKVVPYVHGEIDGVLTRFEGGKEICKEQYRNGIRDGQTVRTKAPRVDEEYAQGKLTYGYYYDMDDALICFVDEGEGEQALFENTHLKTLCEIKGGILEGSVKEYGEDGALVSTYSIKNGVKHGIEEVYYPTGAVKLSLSWRDGLLHGPAKTWYENGSQESEKEMFKNKRHGLCLAWYLDGNIMQIEEYENDMLIKGSYMKRGEKEAVSTVETGSGLATLFDQDGYLIERVPYEKGSPSQTL